MIILRRVVMVVTSAAVFCAWSCSGGTGGGADVVDAIPGSDSVVLAEVKPIDGPGAGEEACKPDCEGKECGDDGCGGACGECVEGVPCSEGVCCTPDCEGKICGDDGCGGSCGECPEDEGCVNGDCECVPDCEGKVCGTDRCEGSCGDCPDGHDCVNGQCLCIPNCDGKVCGDNGCGEDCGECGEGEACVDGVCACVPQCLGKECGSDACGGSCGECPGTQDECMDGLCSCVAACELKECGTDGCGGSCGLCGDGLSCVGGECVCLPNCDGKECGLDNCGVESCGECPPEALCEEGICVCEPKCEGLQCGDDSCGGFCGMCPCAECPPSFVECGDGQCVQEQGLTCPGIFDCLGLCPSGNQACQQDCIQGGSTFAQNAFAELVGCYQEVGVYDCWDLCPDDAQTQADCPPEGQACFEATVPLCEDKAVQCFHGGLTCVEMYVCYSVCPDTPCKQDCLANGDPAAQYAWNDFIDCLDDVGYFDCPDGDSECYSVAWDECQPTFHECVSGDLTCMEVRECLEGLELGQPDFSEQMYTCFYNGTGEAQDAYGDLEQCVIDECFTPWDAECWEMTAQDVCKMENKACEDAGGPLDEE